MCSELGNVFRSSCYGLKPESNVRVTEIDGRIVIIPIFDDPIKDTRGILKKKYPEETLTTGEIIKDMDGRKLLSLSVSKT